VFVIVCALLSTTGTEAPALDAQRAKAVLAPFAEGEREQRLALGVGYSAVAAGLIGASITYVAVSYVDNQLSPLDANDTRIAGYVVGAAAVAPAAIGIAQFVMPSNSEARLAKLESGAAPETIRTEIEADANASSIVPVVAGVGLIAAGLGSAGLGAYFLILPHTTEGYKAGPVAHATGAELIGIGVTAVGVGAATMILAGEHEHMQAELLR
jgi:hypothetical protein